LNRSSRVEGEAWGKEKTFDVGLKEETAWGERVCSEVNFKAQRFGAFREVQRPCGACVCADMESTNREGGEEVFTLQGNRLLQVG